MKLKLDENLSRHLKASLQRLGHEAETAAEEGLLSKPDVEIGLAAKKDWRILLTLDLEFGDLRKFPPGNHPGIILFRPRSFGPRAVNAFVERFVVETDLGDLVGCLTVVEPFRVRVRRPPMDQEGNPQCQRRT